MPRYLRSDNGPEFLARKVLSWLQRNGMKTALIDPGKPWQNGMDESFNGKFRDEYRAWNGSGHGTRRRCSSRPGGSITIRCGRMRVSAT